MKLFKEILAWIPVIGFFYTVIYGLKENELPFPQRSMNYIEWNGLYQGLSVGLAFSILMFYIIVL